MTRSDDDPKDAGEADPANEPLEIGEHMLHVADAPRETRRDFEKGMSYAPLVALGLIVVNALAFAALAGFGKLDSAAALLSAGAMDRDAVASGQMWRLFSYMFLHGSFGHLLSNVFMLYVLGMGCEHAFGRVKTLVIYLVAGFAGGVMSGLFTATVSVGASGAIFGLAGALIATLHRNRHTFYIRDKRIGFVVLIWSLYTIGFGFFSPEVDNWCHIGGFVAGVGTGFFVPMREIPPTGAFSIVPTVRR